MHVKCKLKLYPALASKMWVKAEIKVPKKAKVELQTCKWSRTLYCSFRKREALLKKNVGGDL